MTEHEYENCPCGGRRIKWQSLPAAPENRLDRGDAVNLASGIVSRLDTGSYNTVTDKGVKVLADAVMLMDAELRRLYALSDTGRSYEDGLEDAAKAAESVQDALWTKWTQTALEMFCTARTNIATAIRALKKAAPQDTALKREEAIARGDTRGSGLPAESAAQCVSAAPVAWIVQAKDAPNSPRYLQWDKEGIGLLQQHQCNHTPLYATPPNSSATKD